MGSVSFGHVFNHYDWRMGIRELQRQADEEYGHQQGYSGAINSCDHFTLHRPNRPLRNMQDVWDYADSRLEHLGKREGEVIDLGITGYSIAKPVVNEFGGIWLMIRGYCEDAKSLPCF